MNPNQELQQLFSDAASGKFPKTLPPSAQAILDGIGSRLAQTAALALFTGVTFLANPTVAKAQIGRTDSVLLGGAVGMLLGHGNGRTLEGALVGGLAGGALQSVTSGAPDRDAMVGVALGAGVGEALGGHRRDRIVYAIAGATVAGVIGNQLDLQRGVGAPTVAVVVAAPQPQVIDVAPPTSVVYAVPPPVLVYEEPPVAIVEESPFRGSPEQRRPVPERNPHEWHPAGPGVGHWVPEGRVEALAPVSKAHLVEQSKHLAVAAQAAHLSEHSGPGMGR